MNKIRNLIQNIFKMKQKTQDDSSDFTHDNTGDIPPLDQDNETNYDITNTKLTLREKLDVLTTRFGDKFRGLNNKEMSRKTSGIGPSSKSLAIFKKKTANINWEQLPNNILSSAHHQRIHNYFQLAVIICLVYFFASLISHLLMGTPSYKTASKSGSINIDDSKLLTANKINKIKNANIFQTTEVAVVKDDKRKSNADKKCEESDRKSNLPIKLVNTIVLQDSVKSIASVSIRSNSKLENFRVGDKISSLASIGRIGRQKLIIKNLATGDCEAIEGDLGARKKHRGGNELTVLTPKASRDYKKQMKKVEGIETDGVNFKIKKEFLQEKLKDVNSLLTQARGIKIDNPDGSLSFKIVDIEPGSIYDYLGIQNGDIIKGIDGEPIRNFNEVMKLFGNVANLKKMNLTVGRDGEDTARAYNIE